MCLVQRETLRHSTANSIADTATALGYSNSPQQPVVQQTGNTQHLGVNHYFTIEHGGNNISVIWAGSKHYADEHHDDAAMDVKKKRTFRKFSYRGIDLDKLLDLSSEQLMDLVNARPRRRFQRGLKRKPMGLIKKLRQAKKDAPAMEKPAVVKTHLRNMIVVPEMIGSVVGVYNGKTFNQVEIKPEMIGHYLGEFSITYKPVKHGRPGIGATHSSRFIPLK
ncbi:ribosomal protein S15 [Podila horticola]|nr:ribosomal protein S15 [Podila horticola]